VQVLSAQSKAFLIPVEILCLDDGSDSNVKEKNRKISSLPNVNYQELGRNIGRAAIRNALARNAQYDFLLFLDGDSKVVSPDFLAKYLAILPTDAVWMGGRIYDRHPPDDNRLFLHWKYGTQRESKPAAVRALTPFHHFMTNNFLLPKSVFFSVPLDEAVQGYGHEDTLWAFSLQKHKISIRHLENPVVHLGLESNKVFLEKSRAAVRNLALITDDNKEISTRLQTAYHRLKKLKLIVLFRFFICPFARFFEKNLLSSSPKLIFLDLLKLCWFSNLKN